MYINYETQGPPYEGFTVITNHGVLIFKIYIESPHSYCNLL